MREMADAAPVSIGSGAIVVPADDVMGFAGALGLLLGEEDLRSRMGAVAYEITVPAFGWDRLAAGFLDDVARAGHG